MTRKRVRKEPFEIANARYLRDLERFERRPALARLAESRRVAPRFSPVEAGSGASSSAGWDVRDR